MRMMRYLAGLAAVALLSPSWSASAQSASALDVRLAFVYNFAKFTEWPADAMAPSAPLMVCVLNDQAATDALRRIIKGRAAGAHGLKMRAVQTGDEIASCHVLYAPKLDAASASHLLTAVGELPVLTISDYEGFARLGGIANFIDDGRKVRFAINVESARRARLRVSSQLLTLAQLVRGADARP